MNNDSVVNPMDVVLLHDDIETMKASFDYLDQRERKIIELRFGLTGNNPQTLDECAKAIHRTRERARQLQMRALLKLRACLELQSYGEEEIDPSYNYSFEEAMIIHDGYYICNNYLMCKNEADLVMKAADTLCNGIFHHPLSKATCRLVENGKILYITYINHNLFVSDNKLSIYKRFLEHYSKKIKLYK